MVPIIFMNVCKKQGPSSLLYHMTHYLSDQDTQVLLLDEYPVSHNMSHFFHVSSKFDILQVLNGYVSLESAVVSVDNCALLSCARYAKESSRRSSDFFHGLPMTLASSIGKSAFSVDSIFLAGLHAPKSLSAYGFFDWGLVFIVDPYFFSYQSLLKKLIALTVSQNIKKTCLIMTDICQDTEEMALVVIDKIVSLCRSELSLSVEFIGSLPKEHAYLSSTVLKKPIHRLFPDSYSAHSIKKIASFFKKDISVSRMSHDAVDLLAS